MSKLIDSLKVSSKEPVEKQPSDHQLTQEQLADVYFAGGEKKKKSEYPMVIKVVEKRSAVSFLPWLITSVALLLTALALFTTKRIFVDIHIIDEKSPYFRAERAGSASTPPSGSTAIPLEQVVFEGAARLNSSSNGKSLTLANSSVANFARANVLFKSPLDLSA